MKVYVVKVITKMFCNEIEGVFSTIEKAEEYLANKAQEVDLYKKIKAEIIPFVIDSKSDLDNNIEEMKNLDVISGDGLSHILENVDKYGHFEHATTWIYEEKNNER